MKRVFLPAIVLMIFGAFNSNAQTSDFEYKNDFKVGGFYLFANALDLQYERMFNESKSIVLRGNLRYYDNGYNRKFGTLGEIQYRYYFLRNSPTDKYPFKVGLYAAPYLFAKYLEEEDHDQYYYDEVLQESVYDPYNEYKSIGFGIYGGLKLIAFQKISIDVNFGGGLKITDEKYQKNYYSYNIFDEGFSGVVPRANITFGFIF